MGDVLIGSAPTGMCNINMPCSLYYYVMYSCSLHIHKGFFCQRLDLMFVLLIYRILRKWLFCDSRFWNISACGSNGKQESEGGCSGFPSVVLVVIPSYFCFSLCRL